MYKRQALYNRSQRLRGQRKIKTRKMFPGYVIIKMIVTNESWYLVRNTQGVTGFVAVSYTHLDVYKRQLLRGVQRDEIERGQVLAKPGTIHPHTKFKGCLLYTSL